MIMRVYGISSHSLVGVESRTTSEVSSVEVDQI
jgi:hypothetical protein